jgi:hypothetical protein
MAHIPIGRVVLPRHGQFLQPIAIPKKFKMSDLIGTRKEVLESTPPHIPSITQGTCDTENITNKNLEKVLGYTEFATGRTENYSWWLLKTKYNPKALMLITSKLFDRYSHAVAIFDRGDHYEYYDSNGLDMPPELRTILQEKPNPMKVNTTNFQARPSCIRHALIRLAFPQLSNIWFNALVIKTARETGFTPEQAIVALSNNVLKGITYAPGRQSGMGKPKICKKCHGYK